VPSDIARVVRQQNIDLVLMGYHVPVFGRALLGGTVHRVLTGADCDVAVFVQKNYREPTKILVPFLGTTHDKLALQLAGRMARSTGAEISIVHVTQAGDATAQPAVEREFADPAEKAKVKVKVVTGRTPTEAVLEEAPHHDLMIIGVAEEWGLASSLLGLRAERIANESPVSMLIVRRFQSAGAAAAPALSETVAAT
jgi:nucleotide-binding universal stress UspA family protein